MFNHRVMPWYFGNLLIGKLQVFGQGFEMVDRRGGLWYFGDLGNCKLITVFTNDRSSHRDSSRSNLFIIFQEGPFVPRTVINFPGGSICLSNRHEFSRRAYLFIKQTFLSNRTDTNFPRNPF